MPGPTVPASTVREEITYLAKLRDSVVGDSPFPSQMPRFFKEHLHVSLADSRHLKDIRELLDMERVIPQSPPCTN